MPANLPKLSAVNAALEEIATLAPQTRVQVLKAMRAAGHALDDIGDGELQAAAAGKTQLRKLLTPIEASRDQYNLPLLNQILATCARHGFGIRDDEYIDLIELDEKLKERKVSVDERVFLKTAMAKLRLLA